MTLGILSDTHAYVHPGLHKELAGCDLLLHAGDIGNVAVLDELQQIAPVKAVWGNIDGFDVRRLVPETQDLELEGVRFWMTHIGGRPGRWAKSIGPALRARRPDVFICGHSHILRIERVPSLGRMLYLNPGACGRQGFHQVKTCVRVRVEAGRLFDAAVIELT
ncbi:MAG: metallophosphoesterase family protein [Bacteroidota bacterium]